MFDLDRTLIDGSSLVPMSRALARSGVVSYLHLTATTMANVAFVRRGASPASAERVCAAVLRALRGVPIRSLESLVPDVLDELLASIRPLVRQLLDRHLVAGDHCVLLSASPHPLVAALAAELGATGIGTRPEVRDGRLTGRLDGPFCHGEGKLARLRDEMGVFELRSASAYADAYSDLPLLRACGFPVAVSPDRSLRTEARRLGWPVLDVPVLTQPPAVAR